MPWYGFTYQGVVDIPPVDSPVLTGQIFMYAGANPPTGFLKCDGSELLIANYLDLYNVFNDNGVLFGTPSDGFHFVLPNFSSRFTVGQNTADTAFDADPLIDLSVVGNTGGSLSHSHTSSTPTHTHSTPDHSHFVANHDHSLGSHTHTVPSHSHGAGTLAPAQTSPVANDFVTNSGAVGTLVYTAPMNHTHDISGSTGSAGGTSTGPRNGLNSPINITNGNPTLSSTTSTSTTVAGGPTAVDAAPALGNDRLPPYYSVYYIIKT